MTIQEVNGFTVIGVDLAKGEDTTSAVFFDGRKIIGVIENIKKETPNE